MLVDECAETLEVPKQRAENSFRLARYVDGEQVDKLQSPMEASSVKEQGGWHGEDLGPVPH